MLCDLAKFGETLRMDEQNETVDEVAFGCRGKGFAGESEWFELLWRQKAADALLEFRGQRIHVSLVWRSRKRGR